jgi:hypothetical protein
MTQSSKDLFSLRREIRKQKGFDRLVRKATTRMKAWGQVARLEVNAGGLTRKAGAVGIVPERAVRVAATKAAAALGKK